MGWWSASSLKHRLSISMCSWLMAVPRARGHNGVALDETFDRRSDRSRPAAHLEQPRLQLFQLFLKVGTMRSGAI
jgi:hypothetical protein